MKIIVRIVSNNTFATNIYSLESWDMLLILDNDVYAHTNFRYICRYFLIIEIKGKSYYLVEIILI